MYIFINLIFYITFILGFVYKLYMNEHTNRLID